MAGQNRSSYARSNRGLAAFFRGAFILLVALTLSFGLGFFVIARMVPTGVPEAAGTSSPGGSPNGGVAGGAPTNLHSQHSDTPKSSTQTTEKPVQPVPTAQDGPVILPDGDVQKPDNVETNGANPNSSGPAETDATDAANSKPHGGSRTEGDENTGAGPTSGDQPVDSAGLRHSRRGRTSGPDTGSVQPAGSPDSTDAPANDSTRTVTSDAPTVVKSGIYRVQIGVYSTREKAEEVARSAADKGIATTLHIVTRDGRTLYRVQRSTHRDRSKAELDRQKLIDAGFDATIINPS